jgi:hypothetical protein
MRLSDVVRLSARDESGGFKYGEEIPVHSDFATATRSEQL